MQFSNLRHEAMFFFVFTYSHYALIGLQPSYTLWRGASACTEHAARFITAEDSIVWLQILSSGSWTILLLRLPLN